MKTLQIRHVPDDVHRILKARAAMAGMSLSEYMLAEHDGVLAVGGGAVLDEGTRELLRGRTVVFLDVGIKDAASRIGLNRDRPLLLGNPRAQWIRLMEARRPVYESVATVTVLTDGRTPDEVAEEIVRLTLR